MSSCLYFSTQTQKDRALPNNNVFDVHVGRQRSTPSAVVGAAMLLQPRETGERSVFLLM
jgi:hypothetical protein